MGAPVTKKRRVKATRVERPRGVAAHFRQTDVSDVQEVRLGMLLDRNCIRFSFYKLIVFCITWS